MRDVAKMLEKLGHDVVEKAPVLPVSPGDALAVITGANTALAVRLAEQQLGRKATEEEFEKLTLVTAHNAGKRTSIDYVAAQLDAFRIARALAEFFTDIDVMLQPTLCLPPLKLGQLDTMGDLKTIAATLAAYMPGTAMFNMSGQPAMSVPLAWNKAGLPLGMMFAGALRRRGDAVPARRATRAGAAVEGPQAGGVRVAATPRDFSPPSTGSPSPSVRRSRRTAACLHARSRRSCRSP
ncbi:MAG: amidase family protein [Rhodoblastus sp.]